MFLDNGSHPMGIDAHIYIICFDVAMAGERYQRKRHQPRMAPSADGFGSTWSKAQQHATKSQVLIE